MPGCLDGLRVIDLSRYIAGPLCAQHLGDLGAEVIKVESLKGEEGRGAFPIYEGFSLYFANFNRNKLGATLNLRTEQGRQLLRELVACSDVLVQNFRVGVMEEIGMTYSHLSEINPRLVMVNISGFGRDSVRANWPVYDEIAQAMSGLMDLTGPKDGLPSLVGTAIVDHITGIYGALGTLAALEHRWRSGRGQEVDVALVSSAMSTLMWNIPLFDLTGQRVPRNGNSHPLHAALNTYATTDGYIHIVCPVDPMWVKLAKAVGHAEMATDPNYATMTARFEHKPEVDRVLAEWAAQRTSKEASDLLSSAGVACGVVRSIPEVAADPEVRQERMILETESPEGKPIEVMGNPLKLRATPVQLRHSPPGLGQDNEYVYCQVLGHSPAELARWRQEEVI